MLHVQCLNRECGAMAFTEDHGNPDAAVECSCCTVHESHEEHVAAVQASGDAACRPLRITVVPGSVAMKSVLA